MRHLKLIPVFLVLLSFYSCDKCWRCKIWQLQPSATGTALTYMGEDEYCEVSAADVHSKLDTHKNDTTDGYECEKFYK